jgi:dihydrofolate reductase
MADELVLTEVDAEFDADTFFPPWDRAAFVEAASENHLSAQGLPFRFVTYQRRADTP